MLAESMTIRSKLYVHLAGIRGPLERARAELARRVSRAEVRGSRNECRRSRSVNAVDQLGLVSKSTDCATAGRDEAVGFDQTRSRLESASRRLGPHIYVLEGLVRLCSVPRSSRANRAGASGEMESRRGRGFGEIERDGRLTEEVVGEGRLGRGHCGGSSGVAQVDGTGRKRGNVGWIRFIHIALIDTAMQLNQSTLR